MTIYATPFKYAPKNSLERAVATGPSKDSGFESLDQVVELMGPDYEARTPRLVVYGPGEDRVVYSKDLTFSIDGQDNKD